MNAEKKRLLNKVVNSYVLAQGDQPYKRLKLLQKYLKTMKIASLDIKELRDMVNKHIIATENREKVSKIEALLFTKEGMPKKHRYGSAFCKKCMMYKDHEKECPYCGGLELTL